MQAELEAARIAFLGVIIGGLITCGFQFILEFFKSKREDKKEIKVKLDETYDKIMQMPYKYASGYKYSLDEGIDIQHKLDRYAPTHIQKLFNTVRENMANNQGVMFTDLINAIRKESGVKGKMEDGK